MSSEFVTEISDESFAEALTASPEPLLLDIWGTKCGPCQRFLPVIEEIARENAGRFRVAKINIDHAGKVIEKYSVRGVPTLLYFKDGEKRDQTTGVIGKAEILCRLEALLG